MIFLKNAIVSYQTTLVGLSILLLEIVHCAQAGTVTADDIVAVLAGFGLVSAKDAHVTGAVK